MLMSWEKFFFMYLSTQALVRISLIFAYFNSSPHTQTYSWLLRPNRASSFTFCQYIKLIYFYSVFVNWMICSSKSKLIEMCSYSSQTCTVHLFEWWLTRYAVQSNKLVLYKYCRNVRYFLKLYCSELFAY